MAASGLGVDLESARAASAALDRDALAAVGVDVGNLNLALPIRTSRRPPFTSGARAVLKHSIIEARSAHSRSIESRHLLLGILACTRPDHAAELLAALSIDPAEARDRLRLRYSSQRDRRRWAV